MAGVVRACVELGILGRCVIRVRCRNDLTTNHQSFFFLIFIRSLLFFFFLVCLCKSLPGCHAYPPKTVSGGWRRGVGEEKTLTGSLQEQPDTPERSRCSVESSSWQVLDIITLLWYSSPSSSYWLQTLTAARFTVTTCPPVDRWWRQTPCLHLHHLWRHYLAVYSLLFTASSLLHKPVWSPSQSSSVLSSWKRRYIYI